MTAIRYTLFAVLVVSVYAELLPWWAALVLWLCAAVGLAAERWFSRTYPLDAPGVIDQRDTDRGLVALHEYDERHPNDDLNRAPGVLDVRNTPRAEAVLAAAERGAA